jgi:hypothetical protein
MSYEKLVRDGKVAVLLTGDYGAGWSTWNRNHPGLLFDQDIVLRILENNRPAALKIAEEKYPGGYFSAVNTIEVAWIPQGQQFFVHEYDGAESLKFKQEFIIA